MVKRGEVHWGPAPHKDSPAYRPWLVVSDSSHPFADEECIALALTTQKHDSGIAVPTDAWIAGGSVKQSYISPSYVATIKHRDFDTHQGTLADEMVDEAVAALHNYTSSGES